MYRYKYMLTTTSNERINISTINFYCVTITRCNNLIVADSIEFFYFLHVFFALSPFFMYYMS